MGDEPDADQRVDAQVPPGCAIARWEWRLGPSLRSRSLARAHSPGHTRTLYAEKCYLCAASCFRSQGPSRNHLMFNEQFLWPQNRPLSKGERVQVTGASNPRYCLSACAFSAVSSTSLRNVITATLRVR